MNREAKAFDLVLGVEIDSQYRCHHYHTIQDVIAIKFKCCDKVYGCYRCHNSLEDHKISKWKKSEFGQEVFLCGACRQWMTINQYLYGASRCFHCSYPLNPNCQKHWKIYFEMSN